MAITQYGYLQERFAGSLYSTSDLVIMTGVNSGGLSLPLGVVVARDTEDGTCCLPSETKTDLLGVSLVSREEKEAGQVATVPDGNAFSYARRGEVNVLTMTAVTPADSVFAITSGTDAGKFTKTSGANTVALPNARWLKTTTEPGVAAVRVSFR